MSVTPDDDQLASLDAHKRAIERAMREAVKEAIALHQRLGLPMVEWHDGKIVFVPADQLAIDEPRPTSP